jgi:hypothetical protein
MAILRGSHWTPELFPLTCKTEEITIDTTNQEDIKRTIANSMYDCWWMLGQGEMEFFTDESWWSLKNLLATEKANCVICSEIKFKDNVKKKNIELDIADYLETTKIPMKDVTYLEYFLGESDKKFPVDVQTPKMSTNKDYAVVFLAMKGPKTISTLKEAGATGIVSGMLIGAGVGALAGGVGAIPGALIGAFAGLISGGLMGGASATLNTIASVSRCDTTSGCNNLILVPFDAEGLKTCQNIKSVP